MDVSRKCAAVLLVALLAGHLAGGMVFLSGHQPPPSYDPAYHFSISMDYHDFFRSALSRPRASLLSEYLNVQEYYPPVFHSLVGLVFLFSGPGVGVARLVMLGLYLVLIAVSYSVGARTAGRRAGLMTAFLISTFPICVGYSRVLYLDMPALVAVAISLLVLGWADDFSRVGRCLVLGLTLGAGMLTKWHYGIFFIGPMLYAIVRHLVPIEWSHAVAWVKGRHPLRLRPLLKWFVLPICLPLLPAKLAGAPGYLLVVLPALYSLGAVLFCAWRMVVELSREGEGDLGRSMRVGWRNLSLALFVAFALAAPWYVLHAGCIADIFLFSLRQAADPEGGMVPLAKEPRLLYYLIRLESDQIQLVYFLLLLVSLWGFWRKGVRGRMLPSLLSLLVAAGVLSMLSLQYPRYGIGYLVFVALIIAVRTSSLTRTPARTVVTAAIVINGLVLYWGKTIGLPWLNDESRNVMAATRWGDLTLYSETGTGNHLDFAKNWKVEEITDCIVRHSRETGFLPGPFGPILLLANDTFFHYHAFTINARMRGSPLEAWTFRYKNTAERVAERVLHAQYVIDKSGYLGPDFSLGELLKARERIDSAGLLGPGLFRLLDCRQLPDGSEAKLYENRLLTVPPADIECTPEVRYENGFILRRLSAGRVGLSGKEAFVFWTEWEETAPDPADLTFFVQARRPDGELVDASGRRFEEGAWMGPDGNRSNSFRYLLFFPGEFSAGEYRLCLGLWYPSSGHRLEARDENGVRLEDDLYFAPESIRFEVP